MNITKRIITFLSLLFVCTYALANGNIYIFNNTNNYTVRYVEGSGRPQDGVIGPHQRATIRLWMPPYRLDNFSVSIDGMDSLEGCPEDMDKVMGNQDLKVVVYESEGKPHCRYNFY